VNEARFRDRLARATASIGEEGLDGLLVTPGADLAYLTGYAPPPFERLTLLVLTPGREPALLVPALERPAALASPVGGWLEIAGWTDGEDPYAAAARLIVGRRIRRGRVTSSGCARPCRGSR
jgi:Xaa-Pro aminopeptidase